MAIEKVTVSEPYLDHTCIVGESPVASAVDENLLFFLDIAKNQLHTLNVKEGPKSHKILPVDLGWISGLANVEGHDNLLVFSGQSSLSLLNLDTLKVKPLVEIWTDEEKTRDKKHEHMRLNDGGVDANGRWWSGTAHIGGATTQKPDCTLLRFDTDLTVHRVEENLFTANGLSFSPDEKTIYWTETMRQRVWAGDYDVSNGSISNKRLFFHHDVPELMQGAPDGHCQDEHGYLWIAVAGAGKICRVSPACEIVKEITFPVRLISACTIVGTDLYATSIHDSVFELPDVNPLSGKMFKVPVGVRGRKLNRFRFSGPVPEL